MFISIEGPDCSGKSTIISILKDKYPDALFIREPGTTLFGEKIRNILLNSEYDLDPVSEILLFSSSFCETSQKVIKPALNKNELIISDRWYYSTIAYQCYANNNKDY